MKVISVSRRTDIPAYYGPWFFERVKAGYLRYPNPMSGKPCTLSLRKEDVLCFVFWSKNFEPFLSTAKELAELGYDFYFHYTITGLGKLYEPRVPDWQESVETFKTLSRTYSPQAVQWRFDPVIINGSISAEDTVLRFRALAEALEGVTHRCYFSFAQYYHKIRALFQNKETGVVEPSDAVKTQLSRALAFEAAQKGIALYSCCNEKWVGSFSRETDYGDNKGGVEKCSIYKARCIDDQLISSLYPGKAGNLKQGPTRTGCGCVESRDVGIYDTCPHHCVYCYANSRFSKADARYSSHCMDRDSLLPLNEEPADRNSGQLELF